MIAAIIRFILSRAAPVVVKTAPRVKNIPKAAPKTFPKTKPGCTQGCLKNICRALAASIWSKATVLADRIKAMMEDKLDLFKIAKDKPSPALPKGSGSWQGHVKQADGVQRSLQGDLKAYDAAKCKEPKIPKQIRDLAYTKLPSRPQK